MEIERKYLAKELPTNLDRCDSHDIMQAYISTDPTVRLRKSDNEYVLAIKSKGHISREEFEFPLTEEQFNHLWTKVETKPVSKTRYDVPIHDGLNAEIDIYKDYLDGLITIEVEFATLSQADNFVPPAWFGIDVSHNSRYKNSSLAIYGKPE